VSAELRALYFLARLEHDRADLEAAQVAYTAVVTRAEEFGVPWSPLAAEARYLAALVAGHRGRLDEAWDGLDVSGQRPPLVFEWMYYAEQVRLDVLRGRGAFQARSRTGDVGAFRALRRYWDRDGLIALTAGTAEISWAERHGDPAAALRVYDDVVATVRPLWHEWFQARLRLATTVVGIAASGAARVSAAEREALGADVERLLDDAARVVEHYADFERAHGPEYVAWNARRQAEALRWRWLAQADPPEAADLVEAWRATEAAFAAYGAVPELARVRARYAEVLRATGDAAGARQQADLARAAAHECRLEPLLEELTALGGIPRPRAAADPAALTPREREILALVAEGRTNGEIGKQLFIATKTASVHVSNILGKLGAGSRTEAVAVARRRGLL
jgi:DNA-binding CsgD family transcriptional regulator